ncbi:hypothetical protein CsatB_000860 [Cannabis sativa]
MPILTTNLKLAATPATFPAPTTNFEKVIRIGKVLGKETSFLVIFLTTMAILTTFLALVATLTTNTPTATSVTFSIPTINFGKFVEIGIVARKITGKIMKKLVSFLHQEINFLMKKPIS